MVSPFCFFIKINGVFIMRLCNILSHKGFTLVEMAIVLVILGLLIGLGSSMITPLTNLAKLRESREIIDSDMTSVLAWAAGNNSLPTVAGFVANTPRINDSWVRPLIYLYDSNLNAPAPANKDTICGRRSTQITLTTIDPPAVISNVAFVIMSQGEEFATVAPTPFTTLDGAPVVASALLTTPPTPRAIVVPVGSDDIVRWVTLDELRNKIGCQGAPLKILNNELPPATVAALYPNAAAGAALAITTDGGAAPVALRWCVETAALAPLPAGLGFSRLVGTPPVPVPLAVPIRVAPNTCNGVNPLAEAGWVLSPTLAISGAPAAASQGAYNFTLFVRDNNDTAGANDNITSKPFVLTVNP